MDNGCFKKWIQGSAIVLFFAAQKIIVYGNGIYGNGTGAASMGMGGADVGWAQSPLEAMGDNPAGLGFLTGNEFDLGGVGESAAGQFHKTTPGNTSSGTLDEMPGALPEAALGMQVGQSPLFVGISSIPQSMLLANWSYRDPNGGLGGVSYDNQTDKSEILLLRSAIGLSLKLNPKFSVGLNFGVDYNKNELVTPYVFQNLSAPDAGYDGAKTLLDLDTSGFGWNCEIGAIYKPTTNLQFGLAYQNKYTVVTTGSATGNAGTQFGHAGDSAYSFRYNTITAGIGYRWRACDLDLAYQCSLPAKQSVGTSGLLSGEYSNTSTTVLLNVVALTMRVHF